MYPRADCSIFRGGVDGDVRAREVACSRGDDSRHTSRRCIPGDSVSLVALDCHALQELKRFLGTPNYCARLKYYWQNLQNGEWS